MWTALKWAVRVAVLAALFVGYKAVTFEPLLRALAAELPEPTKFSRPPDAYDWKTFGAPIKAGFSKRDITPKETLVWLAGYYPPHPKTSIHDQIWVKSLALQDDHGQIAVFVSVDLIGLLPDEIAKIKHGALGIVNEYRMFISCTHTHSGPDTMGLWGPPPFTGKRRNYQKFMREEIIASIKEAVLNLQDAKIRFGGADFPNYAGGRHENPNDPSVSVLQVLFSNTGPVTLVNYACHADVAMTMQMTADFPYYLYERLGRLTGGEVMYIPGAIGGVQPRKNGFETWPYFVRTLGENLADFVHFQIMKNPIAPKWIQIGVTRTEVKS
ncbi:MAG: hypothetical protein Q8P76_02735, partial [bacterium]|nr:hypothetical protein [bacterium]